jgi:hypothetical protein
MDNRARDTLREVVVSYGAVLTQDSSLCEALLRDLCGSCRREINLLIGAIKAQVASDLMSESTGMPVEMQHARLAARLCGEQGLTEEAARWTVEAWAFALGLPTVPIPASSAANTPPSAPAARPKKPPSKSRPDAKAATVGNPSPAKAKSEPKQASPGASAAVASLSGKILTNLNQISPTAAVATSSPGISTNMPEEGLPADPISRGSAQVYVWLAVAAVAGVVAWVYFSSHDRASRINARTPSPTETRTVACPTGTYGPDGRYLPPPPVLGASCPISPAPARQ